MATLEYDFDIFCTTCKKRVEGFFNKGELYIEPCDTCLNNEYEKGRDENDNN